MPKNLRDILFGPESYLPNPDVAALFRARYNEDYLKYQPGYIEESSSAQYYNQAPFDIRVAPLVSRSFSGKISKYNEQTSDLIHHILIDKIRTQLIDKIQSNLYRDSALRRMLGHTKGASREISLKVEVANYPRVDVSLSGPFWLRFFYYGRRAFTLHGRPENTKAHGKLVFYDPETLDKIVVSQVHMKAIPPGLYVEKAVEEIRNQLNDPRFLDDYLGDVEDRENLQQNLERQLDRVRTEQGLQVTSLLQGLETGNLTAAAVQLVVKSLQAKEEAALANLRSAVQKYTVKGLPETREAKKDVYDSLREYLANVKTHVLSTSNILTELPVNLSKRSTPRKIISSYR